MHPLSTLICPSGKPGLGAFDYGEETGLIGLYYIKIKIPLQYLRLEAKLNKIRHHYGYCLAIANLDEVIYSSLALLSANYK